EPYKGITTDFKPTKKSTKENILPDITELQPVKTLANAVPDFLIPNIYTVNDFKLIVNNQIALYKTTGQLFTIVSLRINQFSSAETKISFEQLNTVVRSIANKKDKICTIGEKIYILLTKSENGVVEEFINKVHN